VQYIKNYIYLGPLLVAGFALWRYVLSDQVRAWAGPQMWPFIVLPALGLLAPHVAIYYVAVFGCMVLIPRSRIEAVGLYLVLCLTLPMVSVYTEYATMRLLNLNTSQIAAMGLIASFRFPAGNSAFRPRWTIHDTAMLMMAGILLVISVRVVDTSFTVFLRELISITLQFAVPYWLISRAPFLNEDPRRLVFYFAMAGFVLAIEGTFEMLRYWSLYAPIETNLGTLSGRVLSLRGGLLRAPGPYLESTTFGMFLALATIMMAAVPSMFRSKSAYYLAVAVGCMGTFATLARNPLVGVVLGLVFVGLYRGRIGLAAAVTGFSGLSVLAFVIVSPDSWLAASLVGTSGQASQSAEYRENLLEATLPLIAAKPLFGWRIEDVFDVLSPTMQSSHLSVDFVNSYVYFTVASGAVGLSIFLFYTLAPLYALLKHRRRILFRRFEAEPATALFACLGAMVVMVAFTSYYERVPLFAMFFIAAAKQLQTRALSMQGSPVDGGRPAIARRLLVMDPSGRNTDAAPAAFSSSGLVR